MGIKEFEPSELGEHSLELPDQGEWRDIELSGLDDDLFIQKSKKSKNIKLPIIWFRVIVLVLGLLVLIAAIIFGFNVLLV